MRVQTTGMVSLLAALVMLVGCGGDSSSDDASSEDRTKPTEPTEPVDAAEAAGEVDVAADVDCASLAEAAAPDQALRSFPDNPDVVWTVAGVTTDAQGHVLTEIVPAPDEVGYPRFRQVAACEGDEVVVLGHYAYEDAGWILLSTTDAANGVDLAPTLPA